MYHSYYSMLKIKFRNILKMFYAFKTLILDPNIIMKIYTWNRYN